jgi:hypothetical protein
MNLLSRLGARLVLAMLALLFLLPARSSAQGNGLPAQLSDQEFWRTIVQFSEPSGQYTGDNWISNEASIQNVIPPLKQLTKPGGVYLGVGPEQNYTYMWALQSKIGFIIDIRRQNMLNVMLFKALFEMSPTRADFVANLFSRRRPAGIDATTNVKALMAAIESAPKEGLAANTATVRSIFAKHGFALSEEDLSTIDFIYGIFNRGGPMITAEFASPGSPGGVPVTYADLMTATDKNGEAWSYLSSEAAYQYVKELHRKNLIIPLVGDFAGRTTIRMVSDYLKQRNATVTAFYISNVEMYLSGQVMKNFHANVSTLPIDSSSMFIRWAPRPAIPSVPWYTPDMGGIWGVATMLSPISDMVELYRTGRSPSTYQDTYRATVDPMTLVASMQDPSLRRVTGKVTGLAGLKPNESLRVELVENLRPSGLIITAEVAADGSFVVKNVSPRTYQAVVLRTCTGCNYSRVGGAAVNVVVTDKDITGLQLVLNPQ